MGYGEIRMIPGALPPKKRPNVGDNDLRFTAANPYAQIGTLWSVGHSVSSGTRTLIRLGTSASFTSAGTVERVRINIYNRADIVSIQFRVFRLDGSTYDEVGASEVIPDTSLVNGWNTLTLTTPIAGVQVGDFLALVLVVDANTANELYGRQGLNTTAYKVAYSNADISGANQSFATTINGYTLDWEAQVAASIKPANIYATGTAWAAGTASGTRTFLCHGHKARIQQAGTITKVRINITDKADIASIQFRVFRYDGSTYDEVDASEVIADTRLANGWNTLTLTSPIVSVLPGDFVAVVLVVDGNTAAEFAGVQGLDAEDWAVLYSDSDITGANQTFAETLTGYSLPIECQMAAPLTLCIGDAFASGVTDSGTTYCRSFIESLPAGKTWTDVSAHDNVCGYLEDANAEYAAWQNHGIGASTAAQWATTGEDYITTWAINYAPQSVVISLGFGDAMADTSVSGFMAAVKNITVALKRAGIRPIWWTVLQDQDGTGAKKLLIRQYNAAMKRYCRLQRVACVDAWTLLGSDEDPDVRDESTYGTGEHPNSTAYAAIATEVDTAGEPVYRFSGISDRVIDGGGQTLYQRAENTATVEIVNCQGIMFRNWNLIGLGTETPWGSSASNGTAAIKIIDSSDVTIDSNTITNHAGGGIRFRGTCPNLTITNNDVTGKGAAIIYKGANGSDAAIGHMGGPATCDDLLIQNNDVSGHAFGIFISLGARQVVDTNTIHDIPGQHGLYAQPGGELTVSGNTVTDIAYSGLKVQNNREANQTQQITITENDVTDCGQAGILVADTIGTYYYTAVAITDNNVTRAVHGLYLRRVRDAVLDGNVLTDCTLPDVYDDVTYAPPQP